MKETKYKKKKYVSVGKSTNTYIYRNSYATCEIMLASFDNIMITVITLKHLIFKNVFSYTMGTAKNGTKKRHTSKRKNGILVGSL